MDEQEQPICFGTKEYSTTSLICRRCLWQNKCGEVTPKMANNVISRTSKDRTTLPRVDLD